MKIDRDEIDSCYADQLKDEIGESLRALQAFDISLAETFPRSFLEFRGDAYRMDDFESAVDDAYASVTECLSYANMVDESFRDR